MERRKPTAAQLAARDRHAGEPYREELLLRGHVWAAATVAGLLLTPPAWSALRPELAPPLWLAVPVTGVVGLAFWKGYRWIDALVAVVFAGTALEGVWAAALGLAPWWLAGVVAVACATLIVGIRRSRGLVEFLRQQAAQRPEAMREVWVVLGVVALAVLTVALWVGIGLRTF